MGVQITSSSTQVTISGAVSTAIPQLPTGATMVYGGFSGNIAGAATTDLYTVTAGKTLYVTSAYGNTPLGGASAQVTLKTDGTVFAGFGGTAGTGTSCSLGGQPVATCAATKKIQYTSSGAINSVSLGFSGYEI